MAPNSTRHALMWRLVLAGICSFGEAKRMTLCEMLDGNEQLDLKDEVERLAMARSEKK